MQNQLTGDILKLCKRGLMRVTDDMKSKNRTDRTGFVAAEGKESRNAFASSSTKAPAKLVLQMGRKWVVEHHIGNKSLIIEDCDTKQSVYVFGCKDCVLQVKGKVNNITIDKCSKMGVLFKGVVAACEVVNCNSVEVQCEDSAPTISIDNTSGCQLYLSKVQCSRSPGSVFGISAAVRFCLGCGFFIVLGRAFLTPAVYSCIQRWAIYNITNISLRLLTRCCSFLFRSTSYAAVVVCTI